VTTGCDNRYQFVRADDIRQIQLVDHLRPTFDIVPNIAKTKKRNRLDSLDRPSWTAKLRRISLFVTKKHVKLAFDLLGIRPPEGPIKLQLIIQNRQRKTMETTLEITYRSLHIFTRVNHSQPLYPPGLQNQSA
jgi:hypothetical protein